MHDSVIQLKMSHFAPRFSTKGVLRFTDSGGAYHSIGLVWLEAACLHSAKPREITRAKARLEAPLDNPRTAPYRQTKKLGDAVAAKLGFPLSADSWRCPTQAVSRCDSAVAMPTKCAVIYFGDWTLPCPFSVLHGELCLLHNS